MNKKEFLKKWKIDKTTVYYYKKRFPEIIQEGQINHSKLDSILTERLEIKAKVQKLLKKKNPTEINFVFNGKNSKIMSYNFYQQLYEKKEQICVRQNVYEKYLKILKHFGDTDVKND